MAEHPNVSLAGFQDAATVTAEGQNLQVLPAGVTFRDATTHVDDRGSVCELFDPRWGWHQDPLTFVYTFSLRPGMVKGWGMHLQHEDRYFILSGDIEIVMYDARAASPTYSLLSKVVMTEHHRRLMNIPAGIWHANHNIGSKDAIVINFPTMPYDHSRPDKYRLPLDTEEIPYKFQNARGW